MLKPTDSIDIFEGKISDCREGDVVRCERANRIQDEDVLRYRKIARIAQNGQNVNVIFIRDFSDTDDMESWYDEVTVPEWSDVLLQAQFPIILDTNGNLIRYWVNMYEVDQGYGGSEEGGWWFPVGTIQASIPFAEYDQAHDFAESFRERYPDDGDYPTHSVLYNGGNYEVRVQEEQGKDYPETKPHYE